MSTTSDILLSLIRGAIGATTDNIPAKDIQWDEVHRLSAEQGVSGIAVEGFNERLSVIGYRLSTSSDTTFQELEELKYAWLGETLVREQEYLANKKAIGDLARFYDKHGLKIMVLKGYGLSLNWPIPSRRPIGDIDIYTFGQWRFADKVISENLGISVDQSHHHHTLFQFEGQLVENHYDFINTKAHKEATAIDEKLKQLATKSIKHEIDGVKIYLPSATFNAIFLVRHMGQHFAGERIVLRHLLDWGLFLRHVNESEEHIDWVDVLSCWKEMRIEKFAKAINTVCKKYLGIDEKTFHGMLLDEDDPLVERVMNDILSPEFSEDGSGVIFKFRRWCANIWKHRLVYNQPLIPMFFTLAWSHVRKPKLD